MATSTPLPKTASPPPPASLPSETLPTAGTSIATEEPDYPIPPPKRVFFIKVRYWHGGRGTPLPLAPADLGGDEP